MFYPILHRSVSIMPVLSSWFFFLFEDETYHKVSVMFGETIKNRTCLVKESVVTVDEEESRGVML